MAALLALLASALLLTARAEILLDQNATSDTIGTRNLPQGRMWQSFTPHSSGALLSLDVYVGVGASTCEPLSLVLLVVDGLPQSFNELTAWADASTTLTPPAALLHRQTVTTTCNAAVCTARECLGWESLVLTQPVGLVENRVVSFALLHVRLSSSGSNALPRVGVAPVIVGSTGRSSLLVSPIFQTRYGQFAFRAFLNTNGDGTGSVALSNKNSQDSDSTGTASYAVALGVIGAVAAIALISLFVVRARRSHSAPVSDEHVEPMTAEQLRMASPRDAWNYLTRVDSASTRKITIGETNVDGPIRYLHDDDEHEDDTSSHASRPTTPSHRGRVSPMTGSTHTLAWQPAAGFGPVQRIAVSEAPASPSSQSTLTAAATTTTTTPAANTTPASAEPKKRRRLPPTPQNVSVTPTASTRTRNAAWSDDESAPASGPATTPATSEKKQRPTVVAEEDVQFDFLPPFVVNQGHEV